MWKKINHIRTISPEEGDEENLNTFSDEQKQNAVAPDHIHDSKGLWWPLTPEQAATGIGLTKHYPDQPEGKVYRGQPDDVKTTPLTPENSERIRGNVQQEWDEMTQKQSGKVIDIKSKEVYLDDTPTEEFSEEDPQRFLERMTEPGELIRAMRENQRDDDFNRYRGITKETINNGDMCHSSMKGCGFNKGYLNDPPERHPELAHPDCPVHGTGGAMTRHPAGTGRGDRKLDGDSTELAKVIPIKPRSSAMDKKASDDAIDITDKLGDMFKHPLARTVQKNTLTKGVLATQSGATTTPESPDVAQPYEAGDLVAIDNQNKHYIIKKQSLAGQFEPAEGPEATHNNPDSPVNGQPISYFKKAVKNVAVPLTEETTGQPNGSTVSFTHPEYGVQSGTVGDGTHAMFGTDGNCGGFVNPDNMKNYDDVESEEKPNEVTSSIHTSTSNIKCDRCLGPIEPGTELGPSSTGITHKNCPEYTSQDLIDRGADPSRFDSTNTQSISMGDMGKVMVDAANPRIRSGRQIMSNEFNSRQNEDSFGLWYDEDIDGHVKEAWFGNPMNLIRGLSGEDAATDDLEEATQNQINVDTAISTAAESGLDQSTAAEAAYTPIAEQPKMPVTETAKAQVSGKPSPTPTVEKTVGEAQNRTQTINSLIKSTSVQELPQWIEDAKQVIAHDVYDQDEEINQKIDDKKLERDNDETEPNEVGERGCPFGECDMSADEHCEECQACPGDYHGEDCSKSDSYDDSMDGDFDSAMTSAGFGTDEDYGYYGGDEY